MDAKEYFINAYGIYHTSNVVNEKKVDLKYMVLCQLWGSKIVSKYYEMRN